MSIMLARISWLNLFITLPPLHRKDCADIGWTEIGKMSQPKDLLQGWIAVDSEKTQFFLTTHVHVHTARVK